MDGSDVVFVVFDVGWSRDRFHTCVMFRGRSSKRCKGKGFKS